MMACHVISAEIARPDGMHSLAMHKMQKTICPTMHKSEIFKTNLGYSPHGLIST